MNIEIEKNFFVEGIKLHRQGDTQLAVNFYESFKIKFQSFWRKS